MSCDTLSNWHWSLKLQNLSALSEATNKLCAVYLSTESTNVVDTFKSPRFFRRDFIRLNFQDPRPRRERHHLAEDAYSGEVLAWPSP